MQLKNGYFLKRLAVAIASGVGCYILEGEVKRHLVDPYDYSIENHKNNKNISFVSSKIRNLTILLLVAAYSRMCQEEADCEAVKTMNNKEGFISLLKNMQDHIEDPDSKYSVKRLINAIVNPLIALVRFKPSFDERIEYITALK